MDNNRRILIITRCFLPMRDANGNVIAKLASSLQKKGCFIKIAALTGNHVSCKIIKWHNISVKSIYVPEIKTIRQLIAELRITSIKPLFTILRKIIFKLCGQLYPLYHKLSLNYIFTSSFIYTIKESLKHEENFDLCIAVLMPQDLLWAVYKLSNNGMLFGKIPVAVYQLDTYWNQERFPLKYKENRFEFEKEYSLNSLFVMTTPQIVAINTKKEPHLLEKLISSEFPLIVKPEKEKNNYFLDSMIHCVFAGALYKNIRPPEKLVQIIASFCTHINPSYKSTFEDINTDREMRFDFFGLGQHMIRNSKYFALAKDRIILHGRVPFEDATHAQLSADILINIDNTTPTQVPSKIFDYISTGKPIVNFYFYDESPTLGYLSKYPLCLNVNVNKLTSEQGATLLNSFIDTMVGKTMPFEEIEDLFRENTPDYVAEQFLAAYSERIDDFMRAK